MMTSGTKGHTLTTKRRARTSIAASALGLAVASIVFGPALAASAYGYEEFYNVNCGTKVTWIQDSSKGVNTLHFRNNTITAQWTNPDTAYHYHQSYPSGWHSISTASAEATGTWGAVDQVATTLTCK